LSDPLTDKERELRRRADEVEGEANRLSVDRALLAIKATLDSERATEEPAALDERVNDLTDEAVRLEAQAAKARLDAESRKPENERSAIRGQQSSEERVLEATNTRRQLMIDAGAFDISPGSEEMLEMALDVEDRMRGRFGEEAAQWRMPFGDAMFGVKRHDGQLRHAAPFPPR
jgi:uncharacterized protein with PhoU and TrkA domain